MLDLPLAEQFLSGLAAARIDDDLDGLMDRFHADAVLRIVGLGEPVTGKSAIRETVQDLVEAFEFLEWRPIATFVDNDGIAVRQKLKVRHRATGKVAETETCEFLTVKDGKCTSYVQFADTALVQDLARGA